MTLWLPVFEFIDISTGIKILRHIKSQGFHRANIATAANGTPLDNDGFSESQKELLEV